MRARLGDMLDDARTLHRLALLQFDLKGGIAAGGHRNLFHHPSLSLWLYAGQSAGSAQTPKQNTLMTGEFQARGFSLPNDYRAKAPENRSGFGKITLQRADLKVPAQIGADALRGCHGSRKSGVIWHFMQEGSTSQRAAVGQGLRPFRGVEDQLDVAISDGVDDMRPSLQHLVHLFGRDAAVGEETLRTRRRHHLEAQRV